MILNDFQKAMLDGEFGEGAAYAGERAMLIGAVDLSPEDNDFMFRNAIVFKSDGEEGPDDLVKALLKGVLKKEFSFAAFRSLVSATLKGEALKKHYQNYPETAAGYAAWEKKAMKLWKKAGSMADTVKDA